MARPRDYQPDEVIPGTVYRVVRLIGAGGMGTVYDVEDTTVGKRYVLKTLHPELRKRDDLAQRMAKEARQLARLRHTNIVDVVTAGVTSDELKLPFYVMEKLNGQNLHMILSKKGSLELPHAIHIAIDLLDALDNAHEKGVVHRDVKPDNIFLHINDSGLTTTKLLDFGIMRVLDEPGVTAGRFMGTLRYAAPEQLRGETPMPQTDLYAAALVLYEMIAGRGPFDDEGDANKIAAAHLTSTPPPILQWGVVIPEALERLIRTALSKDPLKRPKDAFTFASQLRNMNTALAAERRVVSETSPTAVPILGLGTVPPSTPRVAPDLAESSAASMGPAVSTGPVVSAAALAPTEHAMTRAGTPDAKAPLVTSPPSAGPTLRDMQLEQPTDASPGPVDRNAPTKSSAGPLFPVPRVDGSTERMHVVPGVSQGEWRAPSTLRMNAAPPRGVDDGGASDLLARLPVQESPAAPTDGAASSTVTPRVATRVRPVAAVAIGLSLTFATVATLSLLVWGIRSRFSAPEPQPAAAAEALPVGATTPPPAAPTIPPPLDLPEPSAAPAASIAAPTASTAPAAAPAAARYPSSGLRPGVTAEPPQPLRPRPGAPQPQPGPTRRKLPGSGL